MSQKDDRVTLHQTTIMPHLPGMMSLLGLIFSPAAEVHMTTKKDRYTSILFGLGADENQKPHFGEHDLLVNVDVELTQNDFKMINELRGKISMLLKNVPGFKFQPKMNSVNKVQLRNNICQLLIEISSKHRSPLGVVVPSKTEWNWKPFVKSEEYNDAMYPRLVNVEKLMPMSENTRRSKKENAENWSDLGKSTRAMKLSSADSVRNESRRWLTCRFTLEKNCTRSDRSGFVMKHLMLIEKIQKLFKPKTLFSFIH